MFIALAFGFSLMVNVWVFFRISGGLFNPAISLALALVKIISPLRCVLLVVAQILGGISAAALINALLPGSLYVRTRLGGDINTSQGTSQDTFDFRTVFRDVHDCRTCVCRIYACSRRNIKRPSSLPLASVWPCSWRSWLVFTTLAVVSILLEVSAQMLFCILSILTAGYIVLDYTSFD